MKKEQLHDLLNVYRNYLFAIQVRKEFGDKYGDTKEIMEYYEELLKKERILKNNKPFKKR